MTILDSNVWIAFLNKNDSSHKKALSVFKQIDKPIILPEYILLEVSSVLLIKVNKFTADHFIKTVIDNRDIKILTSNNTFFMKVIKTFISSSDQNLSFVDIALLYLSSSYKIITFDKKLQKAIKL